jgi:hypothetical protein
MNLSLKRHKDTRLNVTIRRRMSFKHAFARQSTPQQLDILKDSGPLVSIEYGTDTLSLVESRGA